LGGKATRKNWNRADQRAVSRQKRLNDKKKTRQQPDTGSLTQDYEVHGEKTRRNKERGGDTKKKETGRIKLMSEGKSFKGDSHLKRERDGCEPNTRNEVE